MVLARAIYEFFATEAECADTADRGEPVYLDRQLRLEITDGTAVYISWTWGDVAEDYYVAWQQYSFCNGAVD